VQGLFFLLFLFYAVSPLSCTYASTGTGEGLREDAAASLTGNLKILVWEIICSKLSRSEDGGQAGADVKVLLKKARATLPEDAARKITSPEYISQRQSSWTPDGRHIARIETAAASGHVPGLEFLPFCSDLSPPSA